MAVLNSVQTMIDAIYPVGSVYLTIDDSFDPNVKFGGSWSLIQSGRSLQTTNTGGGQLIEAGLPNITSGEFYMGSYAAHSSLYGDIGPCFYQVGSHYAARAGNDGVKTDIPHARFDASQCSKIYGNSDTVQPPAYTVRAWLREA